jgi:isoleucyl-tRNA synthetase
MKTSKEKMEDKVLDFWKENEIFEKSLKKPSPQGDYVFYDGPPFATGTPHYGHIVGKIMKDVVPRFFTMKGYRVERKWGWDCHGLPIENIVEKEMGNKSKKEVEELGVEKFNDSCRSKVLEYANEWYKVSDKLGRFVDKKNAYHTMDLSFMESVWWVFKQLWEKNLIYKDYRSMHVCPRCETTLSQSEVSDSYENIKDLSCISKFKLLEQDNTFVLSWTTTPWTLIGNVALAVGSDIDYVKVKLEGEYYILAEERLEDVLTEKKYEVVDKFKGEDLLGEKYEALFDYYYKDKELEKRENAWKIYQADFVNTEEGTGVVHIAPAFGQDDMDLGKAKDLPFVQHLEMNGYFKEEVVDFKGLNVKPRENHMETDIEIIKYLARKNLLFSKEKYEHSYPHCWRCDTPLINYATSSWFVAVTKIKKELLKSAEKINWSPAHIKSGRFGNWLEGARDWSISRQRFWASAIPVWECSCGERKVIGSVKELEDLSSQKIDDIHKDKVDQISFPCPKCSGEMKRIPDVLDCWFESASMPYAQMHYPFENEEKLEKNFPAEFIAEGIDQTRTWFYYLHVISVALKSSHAFKNVIANGIVLAEDGKKMSKKLKNYPDPLLIIDKYGADALRSYLLSSPVVRAENLNFSEKGVQEAFRKNVMLLNNIYNFYEMYSEALKEEDWNLYTESDNVLDKWILVKIDKLIKEVEKGVLDYNLNKAMRPITIFIDEFSTWYLRRSRDRLKLGNEKDKKMALSVIRFVFLNLSKVIAPFMPFVAENLWQKVNKYDFLDKDKSVHLESWPKYSSDQEKDDSLLFLMDKVREIVEMGLAERDKAGIKVRQVLSKIEIYTEEMSEGYLNLIAEELNVKKVETKKGEGELKVILDTEISPELQLEGAKRELIRFINLLRKKENLSINDRAEVVLTSSDRFIEEVLDKFKGDIERETLSSNIVFEEDADEDAKKFKINDKELSIAIKKKS